MTRYVLTWHRDHAPLDLLLLRVGISLLARFHFPAAFEDLIARGIRRIVQKSPLSRGFGHLSVTQVLEMLRENDTIRAVVGQKSLERLDPADAVAVADNPALVSLVAKALIASRDPSRRSAVLYEKVALSSAESGQNQVAACFRVITRIAVTIESRHAAGLLRRALTLAAVDIDPYSPPGVANEALGAAAAILQHHPELDSIVFDAARNGVSENLASVVASAVQRRPVSRTELFVGFLKVWKPKEPEAARFASDSDSRFSASDPLTQRRLDHPLSRFPAVAVVLGERVLPWLTGIPVAATSSFLSIQFQWTVGESIGYGVAVGALGLLVAVNVVATELSAARLPGLIARYSVSPPSLRMAYSCVATMAILLIIADIRPSLASDVTAANAGLFISFTALLMILLLALIRRVDAASAATVLERTRRADYRRAGEQLGAYQDRSGLAREALNSMRHVRMTPTPTQIERRAPIVARERGMHLPNLRRVRRLGSREDWANGRLLLHVRSGVGSVVNSGAELGAVVPSPEATVPPRELHRAIRSLTPAPLKDIDEVSEACAILVSMIVELAEKGDERGAARVAEALLELLRAHIEGIRRGRLERKRRRNDSDASFFVPAFASLSRSLIAAYLDSDSPIARSVITSMLDAAIALGVREQLTTHLAARLWEVSGKSGDWLATLSLVRSIGVAGIRQDEKQTMLLCQQVVEGGIQGGEQRIGIETAAHLCIAAIWLNYFRVNDLWKWMLSVFPDDQKFAGDRMLAVVRIGAAGLLSGNVSVSLRAALYLDKTFKVDQLETVVRGRGTVEQFLSDQHGQYLGEDAEAAEVKFLEFTSDVAKAIVLI